MTLEELISILETTLDRAVGGEHPARLTLAAIGMDSLELATFQFAIEEQVGLLEIPVRDGILDPTWTLLELHHFIQAALDRREQAHH